MRILPRLSIATKLYAIFALLAVVTVALAAVAVVNARHHNILTQEFEAAAQGAKHVERLNGLVYAVTMESRGIYMSPNIEAAAPFVNGLRSMPRRVRPAFTRNASSPMTSNSTLVCWAKTVRNAPKRCTLRSKTS